MQGSYLLFTAIFLVLVVALGFLGHHQAKKRREAFAAFAAYNGWTYLPADPALARQWRGEPFDQGSNRKAINVVTGAFHGRSFVAFDYSYQTRRTDSKGRTSTTTHEYGVVVMNMPGRLPYLEVTHEGIFGGVVANALGFRDIQFESEQFNRTFRVKAPDERFGHAVVHPRMMEMLLARGEIGWRMDGDAVIGWSRGDHQPNQVLGRLDLLKNVLDQVPPYVWRDYAGVDPR
ncbi:hypothetical protein [Kribbella deserti]|uniref:DUF3137 domain-containing protein n=1 Tax=Kribbella deserti TaxID=1926257 RepID=A0ABV6QRE5_9ACTN